MTFTNVNEDLHDVRRSCITFGSDDDKNENENSHVQFQDYLCDTDLCNNMSYKLGQKQTIFDEL